MVKKKRQSDAHNNTSDSSDENVQQSPAGGCQHIKKSVDTGKLRKLLRTSGLLLDCVQCERNAVLTSANAANETVYEYDTTLWLCLKCGLQLCGRSKNQHALQHYNTPRSESHALTMNTRSFKIWCYACDNEVSANSRRNLLECVDMVKKMSSKPPLMSIAAVASATAADGGRDPTAEAIPGSAADISEKIVATWETLRPLVSKEEMNSDLTNDRVLPPPPPPPPVPGVAKRVNDCCENSTAQPLAYVSPLSGSFPIGINSNVAAAAMQFKNSDLPAYENLPRVRGLTNLGNTCFFNAVIQCLAQTPYLLGVLKELSEPGEEFILPGGTFKFNDNEDVELPMIKGTLSSWGSLTSALAHVLEELQTGGGVFTPSKLFDKLCAKCPQFRGGDQHDSHELLRHLLESVRSEDLKRYQRVILQNLGYKDQEISSVSEELRQKCKVYGNQAADRILRPEQVFRGFLVSTLTCRDCLNVSARHEYFLDMSLPVSVEKPQPPQRRKASPENTPMNPYILNPSANGQTKAQLKKEKEKERKGKRAAKHRNNKMKQKLTLEDISGAAGDSRVDPPTIEGNAIRDAINISSSSSETEQSDADVEDNLIDDNVLPNTLGPLSQVETYDSNGNNELSSPGKSEKRDDSPENLDKDSLDEDENDSGIATSPAHAPGGCLPSSDTNGAIIVNHDEKLKLNSIFSVGLNDNDKGDSLNPSGGGDDQEDVAILKQLGNIQVNDDNDKENDKNTNEVKEIGNDVDIEADKGKNGDKNKEKTKDEEKSKDKQKEEEKDKEKDKDKNKDKDKDKDKEQEKDACGKNKRARTQSWSSTIAPRYQCADNECSVQSCLNNFTAVELMTGNNKVGCDNCTKRINGDDPKAKTVNTNATKQFLISSPPAVLILHLKRFQLGPRCIFRKLTRTVSFPMKLDIAPFCRSTVKNLPNIDRKQKKLLYALYGVVEHSGGMYGGHYTAYVKVRPKLAADDKRWKFLPQGSKAELDQKDEQLKNLEEVLAKHQAREIRMRAADDSDDFSNSCNSTSTSTPTSASDLEDATKIPDDEDGAVGGDDEARNVQMPFGRWYYVSDSRVQEVKEDDVLKAQAYLLFYERIY